jgi:hypothetical protein
MGAYCWFPDDRGVIRKRVPILGRCVRFLPFKEICGDANLLRCCFITTNRIRLAIKRQPWVSGLAQIVARQPENAVASASLSSALRHLHSRHRTSTLSE